MPLEGMEQVIVDLRDIPEEIRKELTPMLKQAGESAAAGARANASWSTRIPAAVTVRVGYGVRRPGVTLTVSAKRAPHARPYENLGRPGVFRHPLFGDREHWFPQAARPFAWPAVLARRDEVARDINDIVVGVLRRHGFH